MDDLNQLHVRLHKLVEGYTTSYFDYRAPPMALYHYTTLVGMRGILESAKIWATHMSYLGDPEEAVYGWSVMKKIADVVGKSMSVERSSFMNHPNLESTSAFEYFVDNVTARFPSTMESVFIACFCEQDDLLSQWRAYGTEGAGCELRLLLRGIPEPLLNLERATYRFVKVYYDEKKYRDTLKSLLLETFELWLSIVTHKTTILDASDTTEIFRKHLSAFVRLLTITFKRDGFREEKEWRMVCEMDAHHNLDKIKFRGTNRGLLIPYIELNIADPRRSWRGKVPVTAIRCGPQHLDELNVKAVSLLLEALGYPIFHHDVVKSRVSLSIR